MLLHRLLLRIKGQACFLAAKGAHAIKGHGGASERVQLVAGLCKGKGKGKGYTAISASEGS